mgnify:CR=1 FL=1
MTDSVFSGDDTILLVKQLIRYDIPFLLLGKSSIGKSYSIIEMANRWRMPKSMLYIGSEKPSNIEGLPRLTGQRAGADTLEFYKPNWFPNTFKIEAYVKEGKQLFETYINEFYDGDKEGCLSGKNFEALNAIFEGLFVWEWESSTTTSEGMKLAKLGEGLSEEFLNNKAMNVQRELYSDAEIFKLESEAIEKGKAFVARDDVRDLCLYLSTLLGYGNFWLVLDELDKVDESEQDKYAPLLHIVRERTIKEYSMRTLNDGKGAGVPQKVTMGANYQEVKKTLDEAIEKDMPLLDTRIIGIANATDNIEDALFRRFCHVIVEEVMMVSSPPVEMTAMRECLKEVTEKSNASALMEDLDFKLLNEVNLQWQFGFLPTMLNQQDGVYNFIKANFLDILTSRGINEADLTSIAQGQRATQDELYQRTADTALFKIIRNNFGVDDEMDGADSIEFQKGIYKCLASAIQGATYFSSDEGQSREEIKMNALKQMISEAINDADGDGDMAAKILLTQMKTEAAEVSNNSEAIDWMRKLLSLVEESNETIARKPLVNKFYPVAIEFIAGHRADLDEKNQLTRWLNEFIKTDIQQDEIAKDSAEVSQDALEKITLVNVKNAFVQNKQIAKPIFRALKELGYKKAYKGFADFLLKNKQISQEQHANLLNKIK